MRRECKARGHQSEGSRTRTLALLSTVAAITVLALTSGCGSNERGREYAAPGNLCGTSVNSDEISPFLPAGESISVQKEDHLGSEICEVVPPIRDNIGSQGTKDLGR